MMKEIVQDGAEVLREIAMPVSESMFGSAELARLIHDMAEALDHFPEGVAIAAPQIGVSYRVFIVRKDRTLLSYENAKDGKPPPETKPEIEVYINPEIVKTSRKKAKADEGCLSVHGIYGSTERHERVTIKARKQNGARFERGAGGLLAQIFEHEVDHLNGILFTDHAKRLIRLSHTQHPFAFFGTPIVARDTLATLIRSGFVPAVVITSPDSPRGRGLSITPSDTKTLALANGIPVLTPDNLGENFIKSLVSHGCDYAIVVAYGKIFPEELINAFPRGVLNVHYSLLPKYRGATPLESALLAGENETGVTIQKMAKELDAGDILIQESTAIGIDETAIELRPRLIEMGAKLLVDIVPKYLLGTVTPVAQDEERATRTRKIKKEDGRLELDAPARENWNKYRAYADTIGTYFMSDWRRMKITKASLKGDKFIVERVIPEGKREIPYKDKD
jgi:methionyl-tRNA formyltransferase